MKTLVLYSFFMLVLSLTASAQKKDKCKDALGETDKFYQNGQIQEAIKRCEPCLRKMQTNEERFEAYRLLGLCYQFMNNNKKTLFYIEEMLKLRPDYQKYPNIDPLEFTKLVNKFEVRTTWYAGLKAGFNVNNISLSKSYATYASNQIYYPTIGYQFGGLGEYRYNDWLSLGGELALNGMSVRHEIENAGGWKQKYQESQQYLGLQLDGKYYLPKSFGKLKPYAGLGLRLNYMLSAQVNMESESNEMHTIFQATKDALSERNTLQFFSALKLGVSYPATIGYFSFDISYVYFFRNTVAADKRLDDQNFIFNNQYVNDDISLRTWMFNISYKMPLQWSIQYTE